jgi:hypothetical protein
MGAPGERPAAGTLAGGSAQQVRRLSAAIVALPGKPDWAASALIEREAVSQQPVLAEELHGTPAE